ncbi:MAG: biopolymer transporter TolR [Steroidobacteraceae bacterium]
MPHKIARSGWMLLVAVATLGAVTATHAAPLGQFEAHGDIGAPALSGNATYNAASQEYVLTASGTNMWGTRDEFHSAWRKLQGDFILQARVEFLGTGVDPHRKAGWIVRSSLDADSPYVSTAIHGDGLTSLQFRRTKAAITAQTESPSKGSDVIQLERRGNTYIFSAARYGDPYSTVQIADFDIGAEPYIGLFLCAHNPGVIEQAVFRNVRIIRPAKEGFVPYRDYIGTQLELLELQSGNRQVIHSSAVPFEAPNWTADGAALVYSTSGGDPDTRGRLYRFDLAKRQATLIDTGFAIRNNNDHVLSFDGSMQGISDQSTDAGQSTIFTLPARGGVPKRITALTPSYLHGWSPDGKYLVYTGGRKGNFDIHKTLSDGSGEEIRLTTAQGVDDGPEFTPDGKQIYFNSMRTGKMQIWRMNADGSQQQAVTNDEHNNWFPHLSPDGKWIAMISYVDEIAPAEHPYYKRVYLRLMPVAGGTPKVIAYVYGGQGTINVPSWSPDGRMLAFVSNSDLR